MGKLIHISPYLQDAKHRAVNIRACVKGLPMPIGANRRATAYITHHLLRETLPVLRSSKRQATQKRLRLTIYYIKLSYFINLWAGINFARIIFNYFVAGLGFCCRWLGVLPLAPVTPTTPKPNPTHRPNQDNTNYIVLHQAITFRVFFINPPSSHIFLNYSITTYNYRGKSLSPDQAPSVLVSLILAGTPRNAPMLAVARQLLASLRLKYKQ
jgi:hypothetical protein